MSLDPISSSRYALASYHPVVDKRSQDTEDAFVYSTQDSLDIRYAYSDADLRMKKSSSSLASSLDYAAPKKGCWKRFVECCRRLWAWLVS